MRNVGWNKTRLLLLTLPAIVFLFSTGGSARLTQAPQTDGVKKSDAALVRTPEIDAAAKLQRALSSPRVVTAIIELQSDPVVVHEKKLGSAETRDRKLVLESAEAKAYESQLVREQENFKTLAKQLSAGLRIITELRLLVNAISVEAPGTELAAMATLPGVKRVQLTREYHATLNRSVSLINAPAAWTKVGGSGAAGQGIKIAILDTGIDKNNPLFADAGFTAPAGFPKGITSFTNNKVIAARVFLDPMTNPGATPGDQHGHGTNVAGIAAGDFNTTSPLGAISGVAPRAFLGNYRVLNSAGTGRDDLIIQALQTAQQDGFDIVNLSLGSEADIVMGPLDQAVENAVAAGMTVVIAAGNSGANPQTIQSPGIAPSAITVASSTNSHVVGPIVAVAGTVPPNLMNIGATVGLAGAPSSSLTTTVGPAVYAEVDPSNRGCNPLPAGSLSGKIALIERGICTFVDKANNASAAGAVAAIVYNKDISEGSDGGETLITMLLDDTVQIPSVFVRRSNGLAIRDWLNTHPGAQVSIAPFGESDISADVISTFSSRGPSSLGQLKPDLAAPGEQVYSGAITTSNPGGVSDPSGFAAVSGTSQATPHVAGAAALLKQLHPTWTPLQIKSALISSANNAVFTDNTKTVNAGVLATGSGRVDLSLGSSVKATFSPASLSFGFISAGSLASIDLHITNQSGGADTFTIGVQDLSPGTGVTVSPGVNSVSPAAGQFSTVTINLNAAGNATLGDHTGYLLVTDQSSQLLRVPYWVRTSASTSVQFVQSSFSVTEGAAPGFAHIVVTRQGDTSATATVDYATSDGTASQRTRYIPAFGTLSFAAGQTAASFDVIIINDGYVEQTESINLTLSNAVGASLGNPSQAQILIDDDEESPATTNPLDDATYFVTQHYYDFLSRVPDSGGLQFWTNQIAGTANNNPPPCANGDAPCLTARRITVSNAFFFELEYQQTGSYVYRLYRAAFGNHQPSPNPFPDANFPNENLKLPSYQVFSSDRAKVVGGSNLAQAQLDLANAFVQRTDFLNKYPASLATADQFVDAVLAAIKNDIKDQNGNAVDLTSQRSALITLYNSGGRGAVMYRLADDNVNTNPINNRPFIDAEYNRAFVVTQYFGYLRRDPDIGGFIFWLGQVDSGPLRDTNKQHAMVCSFITSLEYQFRFSPVATHTNSECH
jgi:subtilisin family serine protease